MMRTGEGEVKKTVLIFFKKRGIVNIRQTKPLQDLLDIANHYQAVVLMRTMIKTSGSNLQLTLHNYTTQPHTHIQTRTVMHTNTYTSLYVFAHTHMQRRKFASLPGFALKSTVLSRQFDRCPSPRLSHIFPTCHSRQI